LERTVYDTLIWRHKDGCSVLKPKRKTWFIIADGSKARCFESSGPRKKWTLFDEKSNPDARAPERALGSERPTRGVKIGSGSRFAVDALSEHEKVEETFIQERANVLNAAARDGAFDQIVLAAPPAALGVFRKRLSPEVTSKFIGVFDKDLTNMPDQELFEYFKGRLVRW
jgi:protein required for attachment to host cells